MNAILALLFALAINPSPPTPHPLKMCVCDVKYRQESQRLHLQFKFFWDDLEATLEKQEGRELSLTSPSAENERLLSDFVRKHFCMQVNQKNLTLRYLRAEVEDVVLKVSFAADNLESAPTYRIDLTNDILLDVFPDQYNLVRLDFFGDGNLTTLRFERSEKRHEKLIKP
ncbi:MAG: hypothetical protein JNK77_04800 [Saprospiraceae bacterium]|nr:hypothetical protein [Saprospiraceae bacterium]